MFVECNGPAVLIPESNITDTEEFKVSTPSVLLTLSSELDREVMDKYYLRIEVVDIGLGLTGTIAVTVSGIEVNPIFLLVDINSK